MFMYCIAVYSLSSVDADLLHQTMANMSLSVEHVSTRLNSVLLSLATQNVVKDFLLVCCWLCWSQVPLEALLKCLLVLQELLQDIMQPSLSPALSSLADTLVTKCPVCFHIYTPLLVFAASLYLLMQLSQHRYLVTGVCDRIFVATVYSRARISRDYYISLSVKNLRFITSV